MPKHNLGGASWVETKEASEILLGDFLYINGRVLQLVLDIIIVEKNNHEVLLIKVQPYETDEMSELQFDKEDIMKLRWFPFFNFVWELKVEAAIVFSILAF